MKRDSSIPGRLRTPGYPDPLDPARPEHASTIPPRERGGMGSQRPSGSPSAPPSGSPSDGPRGSPRAASAADLDPEQIVLWVQQGKRCIELREGRNVIGRALDNVVIVDDLQVSRRHAEILVDAGTATLCDLGSANGVRRNGILVNEPQVLSSGDLIRVGRWDLRFRQTPRAELRAQLDHQSRHGETLKEGEVRGSGTGEPEPSASQRSLEILGDLSTKSLALGRVEEAERLLSPVLAEILGLARSGQNVSLSRAERAASLALRLAEARSEGRWANYVVALYTELSRPLPETIIDQLYALRRGLTLDHEALRRYLARLRERQDRFSPNERFALHRLEGLARMIAP